MLHNMKRTPSPSIRFVPVCDAPHRAAITCVIRPVWSDNACDDALTNRLPQNRFCEPIHEGQFTRLQCERIARHGLTTGQGMARLNFVRAGSESRSPV